MVQLVSRFVRSEGRIRTVLGYVALLALPPLLAVIVLASKFSGLQTADAYDRAQLARHLAAGDGFVTSVVRPLSLAFKTDITRHPDLYNAPLPPLVLSFFYRLVHPSERVTAAAGLLIWILCVWLVYGLTRVWSSRAPVAAVAAFAYGVNAPAIASATQGLPYALASMSVLVAAWLALGRARGAEPETAAELPWWRVVLCGAVCALACLTHYLLVVVAIVLGAYLFATQRHGRRALGAFALGLALGLLPWMIRNLVVVYRPLFSLYWYEALTNTSSYPGESVWRVFPAPQSPLAFVLTHPRQALHKVFVGFAEFRGAAFTVVDPLVAFLFVASLFSTTLGLRWRQLAGLVAAGIVLTILGGCLLRPEPALLVAWLPLVCVVAAAQLAHWIENNVSHFTFPGIEITFPRSKESARRHEPPRRRQLGRFSLPPRVARVFAYAAVLLVVAYPLAAYIALAHPTPVGWIHTSFRPLAFWVPEDAAVMTDQPAMAAWYTDRPCVWLFQHEQELVKLERVLRPVHAVTVTSAVLQMPAEERGDWWSWIVAPRGVYRGMAPAERVPPNTMLRMRVAAERPPEIDEARQQVAREPNSSDAHTHLAAEYLKHDWLHDASGEFRDAIRLDPQNAEAVMGLWQVAARLNDTSDALLLAQRANQSNPNDPDTLVALGEAARAFEQGLTARPQDPWLLLSAALCQAKLKHWDKAEQYSRRAAADVPNAITPRLMLGSLYLDQGLIEQAAAEFERLAAEQPNNAIVHEALGRTRRAQGRLPEALDELETAQRLRSRWIAPWLNAGDVQMRLGQYDAAERSFVKALQISPRSLAAALGLIQTLAAQGNIDRAIEQCEKSLQTFPNQPLLLNNIAFFYAEQGRNLNRAIEMAEQLVNSFPNEAVMRDTLGWVYHRAGRHEQAVAQLQRAAALAPLSARTQLHLGQALLAAGRRAEAGDALRTALARGLAGADKAEAERLLTTL
jgi:tetratricopeptide (TPR) repeat protein